MPERTEPVELTLEESGTLCHLLLPHIVALSKAARSRAKPVSMFDDPEIAKAQADRMRDLYAKLSAANDKLMGKLK